LNNKNKYLITILIYAAVLFAQTLNYAEEWNIGHPYPYKDFPPEIQTVRYFSLTQQYLLKDDPKTLLPASNIIDLKGSSIKGNAFHIILMEGWSFQSEDPLKSGKISPEDIIYSIDQASSYLPILDSLDVDLSSMKKVDSDQIIINTNQTSLSLSDSLDIINALRRVIVVPSGSGDDIASFREYPVGAGPFYESKHGPYELLLSSEETEDYIYGDNIPLKEIKIITAIKFNQGTKLKSKKIDIMLEGNVFDLEYCDNKEKYRCEQVGSDFLNLLAINHESPKMQFKEFREALAFAIDKDSFADAWKGTILHGPLSGANAFHKDDITPRTYDLVRAKDYLKTLGYYMDKSGFFQDPGTGTYLSLRILYDKNVEPELISMLKQSLIDLGIKNIATKAKTKPGIEDILANHPDSWDLYYRFEKIQNNQFLRSYFHSNEISKKPNNNWGRYRNKGIDLLFDRFQYSDGTDKKKLGEQIHEELYNDVAIIGLFISPTWAIYHKYVDTYIIPWYFFDKPHKWAIEK